jgi:hypothetical protein
MTHKQINDIARATKSLPRHGYGHQVLVWSDGGHSYVNGTNDTEARGDGAGGWEYPIARLSTPCTRVQVAELLDLAEEDRKAAAEARAWQTAEGERMMAAGLAG